MLNGTPFDKGLTGGEKAAGEEDSLDRIARP